MRTNRKSSKYHNDVKIIVLSSDFSKMDKNLNIENFQKEFKKNFNEIRKAGKQFLDLLKDLTDCITN